MQTRTLGRTGLEVSVLGFGCGAVGGLMVKGNAADQERAVARALELGINYFDTAAMYGNGESERNLGRVLKSLKPDLYLGTKVRIPAAERRNVAAAVTASLEASLQRLQLDHVDLFQLHNHILADGRDSDLTPEIVLGEVVPAFERLREQGKTRFFGITAVGDTAPLHRVADARAFDTAQVSYNMLNPSAGTAVAAGYPAHDFGNLLAHTKAAEMGVIAIRVLAAGALERHRGPSSAGFARRRPDRLGPRLPRRCRARAAARTCSCARAMPTAWSRRRSAMSSRTRRCRPHSSAIRPWNSSNTPPPRRTKGRCRAAALERLAALHNGFVGEAR